MILFDPDTLDILVVYTADTKVFISTTAARTSKNHRDFCPLPAEALRGEGVWAKVQPAALKIWAYLWYRSAWPTDKNPGKPKLAKQLGMAYNSLKLHWGSLVELGLIVEHEQGIEVVVPGRPLAKKTKTESQEEQPKKEKEEKAEQPQQPAIRQKPAPPVKVDSSSAATPSNTDGEHFAEIWNLANTPGLMAQAVPADFTPKVLQNIDTISEQLLLDADVLVRECVANAGLVDYWKSAKQKPDYIFNPRFIQNHKTACAVALQANRIGWDDYLAGMIDNYNAGLSIGEETFGEANDLMLKADESGLVHVREFNSHMNTINFYGMNRQAEKYMICKDMQDDNIHRRTLIDFCKKIGWISAYRRSQGDDEIHDPFIQFLEAYRVLEGKRDIKFPAGL